MGRKFKKNYQKRKNLNIVEFYFDDGSVFLFFDDEGNEVMPACSDISEGRDQRWIDKSEIIKN